MRRPATFAALLCLLLAGCSDGGQGPGGRSDDTGSSVPLDEEDNGVFHVSFEADGPATIEVPFPTLDSCRSAEHWFGGNVTGNGQGAVLAAGDGREGAVLSVSGNGSVAWSSQIEPGPECQTLRYDPWTTDPDPEGRVVEMRVTAGTVSFASVVVRVVRDGCLAAMVYEGQPGSSWTPLDGRGDDTAGC